MKSRFDKDYATIGGKTESQFIKVWDIHNERYLLINWEQFDPVLHEKVQS